MATKHSGKFLEIKNYRDFKIICGTVDSTNLKSIYFEVESYITYNEELTERFKMIKKKLKDFVHDSNNPYFYPQSIIDVSLPENTEINQKKGIRTSFLNIDFNLYYQKKPAHFRNLEHIEIVTNIIHQLIDLIYENKGTNTFSLTDGNAIIKNKNNEQK